MKQMRNLLTGIFLMLGMLLTTLPVVAQGIEAELDSVAKRDDVTSTEQKENHGGCAKRSSSVTLAMLTSGILPHGEKRTSLSHYLLLYIARRLVGTLSSLHGWKKMEDLMKDSL